MKNFNDFYNIFNKLKLNTKKLSLKLKNNNYYWQRSLKIKDFMINNVINVYNGKDFVEVLVTNNMLLKKIGEFSFTRKKVEFLKRRKKK